MQLRFVKFNDPMYSVEQFAEFDVQDVIALEQRQISLLMRGKYWATLVTLKDGTEFLLEGKVSGQIEDAQRQLRRQAATAVN